MGLEIHNGTSFVNATPRIYNGEGWPTPLYVMIYDGTTWQTVWSKLTFDPVPGSYSDITAISTAQFTITASEAVIWSYSYTGAACSVVPVSGTSSTSITMKLTYNGTLRESDISVAAIAGGITHRWSVVLKTGASFF